MAAPTFGTSNPQALDPYPIESVLAKEATGGSAAQAQNMLELYQMQRKAAGNVYGDELQSQHEFARQQLAQQLYTERMKAVPEYLKSGAGSLLGQGGVPGMDLGADPGVLQGVIGAANEGQSAETFNKAATGFQHASEGGLLLPQNAVPGLRNLAPGTLTDTSRVRAEQIKAASRAASGDGHGGGGKTINVPYRTGELDALGYPIYAQVPVPINATDAEIQERIAKAGNILSYTPRGSTMPGSVEPGSTTATPPPTPPPARQAGQPGERLPGVQPKQDGGGTATASPVSAPPATPKPSTTQWITDPKAQQKAKAAIMNLTVQQRNDIAANMHSSNLPIVKMADGRVGFVGLNGTYTLPPAGAPK